MNLTRLILERNKGNHDSVCVTVGDKTYTYGDLFSMIDIASGWLERNTRKGDRVGLFCENGIEFIASYLACLDSGVVVVPINTSFSPDEMGHAVSNCGMKMFLCSDKMNRKLEVDVPVFKISDILSGKGSMRRTGSARRETDNDDLAALIHTSGSTGKPNAVMITHGNLITNTRSILSYLGVRPDDKTMVVLPFYYCYGASLLHMTLCAGGQVVINNKFMFPQRVAREICEKGCTIFAGVPSTYQIMLRYTKMHEMDMSSLRYALQAGGKLPNDHLTKVREALPGTDLVVMYGQTEATARLSYLPPEMLDSKLGSIGRGIPGVELKVVDDDGNDVGPGQTGEIIARGENISSGYLNNEDETRETFRDGWLHTGDLATLDDDGFIFVVDRKKDFVKVGGNRISLTEIEEVVRDREGVVEAVAVGFPDDILGEAIALFVVPDGRGLSPEQVLDICRKGLPAYKMPKTVSMIERIPRNAYGKVQRFRLLEQLGSPQPVGKDIIGKEAGMDG